MKKIAILFLAAFLLLFIPYAGFRVHRIIKTRQVMEDYYEFPYWKSKVEEFSHLPAEDSLVVFLGNSLTEHFNEHMMFKDHVINLGISGDFTEGILKRMDQVTRLKPRKLFIMIGINDIIEKVPPFHMRNNYRHMFHNFSHECPDTQIFIQSILPTIGLESPFTSNRDNVNLIRETNDFLKQLCLKDHLTYIDLFSHFITDTHELNPDLTTDGVHLNEKGYAVWERVLTPFLLKQ
ncbi:MAG: GDSL-type esterase/lipase family protein [Bacteroidetes bacterium]|nr:GDSL-type esterase/lipase family protein [Bacteroidota bacterium]